MESAMENSSPARRVQRVRHEIRQRDVEVAAVRPLGASMLSITFRGDALQDFVSASFDDHVKFIFPDLSGAQERRDYTPRHFDREACELTIEFARHGDGKASGWATRAAIGDRAVIAGPRGSMIIPADYDWHLLVGDETALPAIHRRLEELPAGVKALVIVQLADPADRHELRSNAQLRVQWVDTPDELIAAVRAAALPDGEGFAWGAGEAAMMRRLRDILGAEKGVPKEAIRVSAYWKSGSSSYHQDLD
jgi:NADPH-dependent ferric siderophore reductase